MKKNTRLLNAPLLVLALGGFGIGLTEFVIVGVLPEIAREFSVSADVAGWLISVYALTTALGAVLITTMARRVNKKTVLIGLVLFFILGNAVSAFAPTYSVMMLGRVLAALCHGSFFGIGSVLAAEQVDKKYAAAAISIMFAGLTTANALGVPFGTFIAQATGWRSIFVVIACLGAVTLVGIACFIHSKTPNLENASSLREQVFILFNRGVISTSLVTASGFAAMFGVFTFIGFTMVNGAGFSERSIPWMLVMFGVGLFVGNIVGGRAASIKLDRSLAIFLALLTIDLIVFGLFLENKAISLIALLLMGLFGFAITPGVQVRIMRHAKNAEELASGVNIAAFNIGNAIGAAVCGAVLASTGESSSVMFVGAIFSFIAFCFLLADMKVKTKK